MKEIDITTWNRKEIYEMFSKLDYPFYSVTIPIDVTKVKTISKNKGISFYHLMIWICTKSLNSVPAFNMRIRNNKVYQLDNTHPSFTSMKQGDEHFTIISMPWISDMEEFCANAKEKSSTQKSLFGDSKNTDDLIYFSCTPWFDFTALTNERNFDPSDTIPRIAWGKYYAENDKLMLHLSIDVNHRTIDGFHIGQFKAAIDKEISLLK